MELRAYQSADCAATAALFYHTVHAVAARDYTPLQLDAWAPKSRDLDAWNRSLLAHFALVAVQNGVIVGFGDMDEAAGYLDRLYVHKDCQRQGIATALANALEARAPGDILVTHASRTARPFFEKRGYRVVRAQQVERGGVQLQNFVMEKRRPPAECPGRR